MGFFTNQPPTHLFPSFHHPATHPRRHHLSTTHLPTTPLACKCVPELFWRDRKRQSLENALQINAAQIMRCLDTYRSSPSGGESEEGWKDTQLAWGATQASGIHGESNLAILMNFNRVALSACRAMWAQFNPILMSLGLLLPGMGLCATWSVYSGLYALKDDWNAWLTKQLMVSLQGAAGGAVLVFLGHLALPSYLTVDILD